MVVRGREDMREKMFFFKLNEMSFVFEPLVRRQADIGFKSGDLNQRIVL